MMMYAVAEDMQRLEAFTEARKEAESEIIGSVLSALLSAECERGSMAGPSAMRNEPERDEPGAARFDRVFLPGAAAAQTPLTGRLAAETADLFEVLDAPGGQDELAGPGPLADTLFLDGWREGVPPPRADLVPSDGRGLTLVPAYLVGPVAPRRAPEAVPAREAEPGLTDFIVGRQGRPPAPTDHHAARSAPFQADDLPGVVGPGLPRFVVGPRAEGLNGPSPALPGPAAEADEGDGGE
jgi:hypothetical protein